MNSKIVLAIIIVVLFILENVFVYQTGKNNAEIKYRTQIDTLIEYKTNIIEKIVPKYYTITKRDTLIIEGKDTIYIDNSQYIAQVDTSLENDLAKLKVQYVQDLPLSQNGFFNIDLQVKKETIFVPTKVEPSWWYRRLGFFIGGGYGMDINTKQVNPQVGVYFGINIF